MNKKRLRKGLLAGAAIALLLCTGCRTRYLPVEVENIKTRRVDHTLRDSVFLHDSLYICRQADTVFYTRWRTLWRERVIMDSILVCDTLIKPVTIVREVKVKSPLNYAWLVACWLFFFLWLCRTNLWKKLIGIIKLWLKPVGGIK